MRQIFNAIFAAAFIIAAVNESSAQPGSKKDDAQTGMLAIPFSAMTSNRIQVPLASGGQ